MVAYAKYIFIGLAILFFCYSLSIYLKPLSENKYSKSEQHLASEGRLVWQKYNCQSCHQFYGLGGYLGPDLTNVMQHPQKGREYIKAMLKTGIRQMPKFELSDAETTALIAFLESVNASGTADPRKFLVYKNGMIEIDGKSKN